MNRIRLFLIKLLGGQDKGAIDKKPVSPKPVSKSKSSDLVAPLSDLKVEDIEKKLEKIEGVLEKHSGEQRSIILGAVIATVFIIASVAAEVIIFNANYSVGINEVKNQHHDDYKSLQDEISQMKDNVYNQLLELKLNQSTQTQ